MRELKQCKSLRPFCEFANTAMDVSKADKGYKKYDTAKNSCPKYSADKVVAD